LMTPDDFEKVIGPGRFVAAICMLVLSVFKPRLISTWFVPSLR